MGRPELGWRLVDETVGWHECLWREIDRKHHLGLGAIHQEKSQFRSLGLPTPTVSDVQSLPHRSLVLRASALGSTNGHKSPSADPRNRYNIAPPDRCHPVGVFLPQLGRRQTPFWPTVSVGWHPAPRYQGLEGVAL